MKILALDTAMAACSAALMESDGGHVLASSFVRMERGHAEAIAPMVADVVAASGFKLGNLDRIAVTVGPGTFTGVRIGLAMARGLGLAMGIPVIGVDTLRAVAANEPDAQSPILVVADARNGDVYTALFDAARQPLRPPSIATVAESVLGAPAGCRVIGTAAVEVIATSGRDDLVHSDAGDVPDASRFAILAADLRPTSSMPVPLYLRAPDAKPQVPIASRQAAVSFETATADMAPVLAELHRQCFEEPWDERAFTDLLGMPGASAMIALRGGVLAGFVLTRTAADEAEIITIGVLPPSRRRGVARALLDRQSAELQNSGVRRLFIEVAVSNGAARDLYRTAGFEDAGVRRNYYARADGSREDALLMRKDLAP
jgi:tRNA threonylcarbamoyladenosine biosynthesis protein TsaB